MQQHQAGSMSTTYDPQNIEKKWYATWIEKGVFQAGKRPTAPPYTIVIPPPNVTGALHIGHALDNTLQDVLIRWKRMQGFDALYLPGTDHAGISTQVKVEAMLREEGLDRATLGRDGFLQRVWAWKAQCATHIHAQWATLGLSLDYSRERFTLDEGLSKAVRALFVRLYEQGLIYRGKYMIHWDPVAQTALSDMEVEYKEVQGALYHLAYPLEDSDATIVVATTRPETMLGDTAVAVHPADERYAAYIGKMICLPLTQRRIPIVADDQVDPTFGSGAVKITPAHDLFDFELAQRHGLPSIAIIDETGRMNDETLAFAGMDRFACRKQIVAQLQRLGVLLHTQPHVHQVGHSQRSGAVIEPMLSVQWFVKMKPLADRARHQDAHANTDDTSQRGERFIPSRFELTYRRWMEEMRDWCISRQLWWGHRIPAWYCMDCGEVTVAKDDPIQCAHCGSSHIHQDEDVLDTWFSSALWPFSTLGWPEQRTDYQRYFPTQVLVTGYDIIFFWVARMIVMGLECTNTIPFETVLIHGLVRDGEGRKMSKSLGNGVDPIDVISRYGADALRFMLATTSTPGQDVRFRWERVEQARNFANKLWNAARFLLMNVQEAEEAIGEPHGMDEALSTADEWILHRLNETILHVTDGLQRYDFGESGRALYDFVWDDVCDWYIEIAKMALYGNAPHARQRTQRVLITVLRDTLKLLHPFMPFITEEIWAHLPKGNEEEMVVLASWPVYAVQRIQPESVAQMNTLMTIIHAVRNMRAEKQVPLHQKIVLLLRPADDAIATTLKQNESLLVRFAQTSALTIDPMLQAPEQVLTIVVPGVEIYVPMQELFDIGEEAARLARERGRLDGEVARIEQKLKNDQFMRKAPEAVVTAERQKLETYAQQRQRVLERLVELGRG